MDKKIFVTGATGFVGANLVKRLVQEGNDVGILVRENSDHPFLRDLAVDRIRGNLTDYKGLKKALQGYQTVFHLAGYVSFNIGEYDRCYQVNVEGTRNILKAALKVGVEKVVYIGACAVYGYSKAPSQIRDEQSRPDTPFDKTNPYAYTKTLAEEEVLKASKNGLDAVIVDLCTVYGAGDHALNSGSIIKQVYQGKMRFAPPGGTSYVTVEDVVDGLLLAEEKGKKGESYILAGGNKTYLELINDIAEALDVGRVNSTIPRLLYYPLIMIMSIMERGMGLLGKHHPLFTTQIVKELFCYKYFSAEKARNKLGWIPKREFKDTVKEAFEFYQANGMI